MTSGRAEASLGTFAWFGYELPLSERLSLIRQSGFSHTFLWMGSQEPMVESGRAHEMPGMVADAGLAVDHVHAPYENANAFWSKKPSERDVSVNENLKLIEYCNRHSISSIVLHVTKGPTPRLPMKGIVNWDAVSKGYPTSYEGPVMIEAVPQDFAQPPTEFLADAYQTAVKLREKLVGSV